ncbi:hypothetical protein [Gleimia europaea]|uniref:Uncharacterized protein n=2 Tax=Actinomycetaceae TaxID=2049 RepID=A0A9W5VX55_9ACTO|nr:hypothetical protein [Gleimia europaea]EPD31565.1 hypothetical protein HMPREF9238_01341 [Gleimia europaea ACS-120-V-Col10b]
MNLLTRSITLPLALTLISTYFPSFSDITDDFIIGNDLQSMSVHIDEDVELTNVEVYSTDPFTPDTTLRATRGGGFCTAPAGVQITCQDGTGYVVKKAPVSQMTLGYSWNTAWFSNSNANVIGRGYLNNREVWRGGGIATSGSFTVPWYGPNGSEIMSVKKVKVRSMNPPAGVTVAWR